MPATVTAYLTASPAERAIDFYKQAFGAEELYRIDDNGRIGHAELRIGDTTLMLSDEAVELGAVAPSTLEGTSVSFVIEVPDCDAAVRRAEDAGIRVQRPPRDEPYGRIAWAVDPFGHRWSIHTSNPDFDPASMQ